MKDRISTPVVDFLTEYVNSGTSRLHMPGHKGLAPDFLPAGLKEAYRYDITEISGSDDLYAPSGIIKESEENAGRIFGVKTFYSTEGSSLAVKAMVFLAREHLRNTHPDFTNEQPRIITIGTCHKSFFHAVRLLNIGIERIDEEDLGQILTQLNRILLSETVPPIGVYLTCPDYFGNVPDIKEIKKLLSAHNIPLLADGAHAAYFKFLDRNKYGDYPHPAEYADICCTSAHKTLPALTGAAYLHLNNSMSDVIPLAKQAMEIFGSSSPSYLILASLDAFNAEAASFEKELSLFCEKIRKLKTELTEMGFNVSKSDPLRIVVTKDDKNNGKDFASALKKHHCEFECFDDGYVILMLTPYSSDTDLNRIREAFEDLKKNVPSAVVLQNDHYNCLKNFS